MSILGDGECVACGIALRGVLTAGLGLRSGALWPEILGRVISVLVSGFTIFIAEDFFGLTKVADSSFGTGDGVAGGCVW